MQAQWWKKAIVYQVYPRSFQDSNGDGIGDLKGITKRLPYLESLGVDVVWISPMFQSPMDDNGYDISDYYKVDTMFGSDEDMDILLTEAKNCGIKIILDLVVNHCSDEHAWFQKAIKEPDSKEATYFYFKTTEDGKKPNNWRSNFGGSVWTQIEDGRWYYHTFSQKQPDLNWENKILRQEIYKMINWWLDRGIAGFRVDAITFIKKDLTFASKETENGDLYPVENFESYPGIHEFLSEMKQETFQKHDCLIVAEAPGVPTEEFEDYAGKDGYFSMIFDFSWENMEEEKDKSLPETVERLKAKIFKSQRNNSTNGWTGLFLENHDQSRCINRYFEEKDRGYKSATALATMYFFLHGTPYIYEGQEIGMTNATWNSIEEMDDVRAKGIYRDGIAQGKNQKKLLQYFNELGRDNARTPMQWDKSENAGFTTGKPWLKVQENYKEVNVEEQLLREDSLLSYYKRLIAIHKKDPYEEVFVEGDFEPMWEETIGIIAYQRTFCEKTILVIVNLLNTDNFIPKFQIEDFFCVLNNAEKLKSGEKGLYLQPYQAVIFYKQAL